jgi:hypothetical protein
MAPQIPQNSPIPAFKDALKLDPSLWVQCEGEWGRVVPAIATASPTS